MTERLEDTHRYMASYRARPTNNVMRVGMNSLSDLVIRPGIQRMFRPILLYRGNMSPGHAHRLWNMTLLMMAAECETLSDGIKVLHNDAFAQLCGPVKPVPKTTLMSFYGRLWNSPDVTDLIPGLTKYVKSMQLGPCWLQPVELESDRQFVAPWRVSNHPEFDPKAERPETGIRQLYYPYMAHDPKKKDDGHRIVVLVNEMVPKWLPEPLRADACQELVVGLLSGDVPAGEAHDWVQKYISKVYKMYPALQRANHRGGRENGSFETAFRDRSGTPIPFTERV